jgi:hypothetical protein
MSASAAPHPLTKKWLIARWRRCKMPRLYWRAAHPKWRWDRGEIARFRDGAVVVHYYSLAGIANELIEGNCGER